MRMGAYPTPAQVSVFMGDIWLDDAYRIEYRDQNPLIPLYGYSESEFTSVAQGKQIVQGSLIINYRYPEYLRAAIEGQGRKRVEMDRSVALAHALENTDLANRISVLEEARMQGVGKELKDVFTAKYVPDDDTVSFGPDVSAAEKERLLKQMNQISGRHYGSFSSATRMNPADELELRIYFDSPDRSTYYTVIEGVRLVGRAVAISNSARGAGDSSSSGQNLFELYTFFARRIRSRKVQKWEVDPVDPAYGVTDQQEILNSLTPTPKSEGTES